MSPASGDSLSSRWSTAWHRSCTKPAAKPVRLLCRIWFHWGLDPLAYANKGFAVNEYRAPRWQKVYTDAGRSKTVGDAVLAQRGLPRNGYNRALGFCVLVCLDYTPKP